MWKSSSLVDLTTHCNQMFLEFLWFNQINRYIGNITHLNFYITRVKQRLTIIIIFIIINHLSNLIVDNRYISILLLSIVNICNTTIYFICYFHLDI